MSSNSAIESRTRSLLIRPATLFSALLAVTCVLAALSFARLQGEKGLLLATPSPSPTPTTQASMPARSGQLNDFAHALNDDTQQQVEQALSEFKKRSQIDFVVVLVNRTEGKPIGEQAKALFQGWNVGGGSEGLMLLFATDDRQWRLHSNRAVTRDLPEDKIREVGTAMNPSLAREQYNDAVRRGVETVIKILAAKRGFAPIKIPAPLLPS